MKPVWVTLAALLLMEPAVTGNARSGSGHRHGTQSATHHRSWHHHRRPRAGQGARREGSLQVNPDGTVTPQGLQPPIQTPPEVVKPPARQH